MPSVLNFAFMGVVIALEKPPLGQKNRRRRMHRGNRLASRYRIGEKSRSLRRRASAAHVDYNARLYDPALGRFLSVDPLIAHPESTQGINPYSYVENNPLNKTDPTGEMEADGTCLKTGSSTGLCGATGSHLNYQVGMSKTAGGSVQFSGPLAGPGGHFLATTTDFNSRVSASFASGGGQAQGATGQNPQKASDHTQINGQQQASAGGGPWGAAPPGMNYYNPVTNQWMAHEPGIESVAPSLYFIGGLDLKGGEALVEGAEWVGKEVISGAEKLLGEGASDSTKAIVPYYPGNNGFLGATTRETLEAGQTIDRYGGNAVSRFFSPAGTPASLRALPPGVSEQPLRTFEVLRSFEVESGRVAPAFQQIGLGTQFRTSMTLDELLQREFIREITP